MLEPGQVYVGQIILIGYKGNSSRHLGVIPEPRIRTFVNICRQLRAGIIRI